MLLMNQRRLVRARSVPSSSLNVICSRQTSSDYPASRHDDTDSSYCDVTGNSFVSEKLNLDCINQALVDKPKNLVDSPTEEVCRLPVRTKFDNHICKPMCVKFYNETDIIVTDAGNKKVKVINMAGHLKIECTVSAQYGNLVEPCGVCYSQSGDIIVSDRGAGDIKVFTPEGRLLTRFGKDLVRPTDIAITDRGQTFVIDKNRRDVFIYRTYANRNFSSLKKINNGNFSFADPGGLCLTERGGILVTDASKYTIHSFDSSGKYITEFDPKTTSTAQNIGGGGISQTLTNPLGLSSCCFPQDCVVCADCDNNRVVRYSSDHSVLNREILNAGSGISSPFCVATNNSGLLAVLEESSDSVKIFKYLKGDDK